MAKGQRRSNREAKKPKQPKSEKKTAAALTLLAPERGLTRAQKGRELPGDSVLPCRVEGGRFKPLVPLARELLSSRRKRVRRSIGVVSKGAVLSHGGPAVRIPVPFKAVIGWSAL
jgi:hypothetical protein